MVVKRMEKETIMIIKEIIRAEKFHFWWGVAHGALKNPGAV
jgi:hypothetical protein